MIFTRSSDWNERTNVLRKKWIISLKKISCEDYTQSINVEQDSSITGKFLDRLSIDFKDMNVVRLLLKNSFHLSSLMSRQYDKLLVWISFDIDHSWRYSFEDWLMKLLELIKTLFKNNIIDQIVDDRTKEKRFSRIFIENYQWEWNLSFIKIDS